MRSPGDNCAIHPEPYASYARPKPTGKKIQEGKSEVPKNWKSESCVGLSSSVGTFRRQFQHHFVFRFRCPGFEISLYGQFESVFCCLLPQSWKLRRWEGQTNHNYDLARHFILSRDQKIKSQNHYHNVKLFHSAYHPDITIMLKYAYHPDVPMLNNIKNQNPKSASLSQLYSAYYPDVPMLEEPPRGDDQPLEQGLVLEMFFF